MTRVSTRIGGRYRRRFQPRRLPRIGTGIQTRPDLTRPDLTVLTSYGSHGVLVADVDHLQAVDVRGRDEIRSSQNAIASLGSVIA